MPVKDRAYFNRKAERRGKYYVHNYPGGGFDIWKKGGRSAGFYLPPVDKGKERYAREEKTGKISESMQTYLGYYGILACGKRSQPEGRKFLGLPLVKTGSKKKCRTIISQYWRPRRNKSGSFEPTLNTGRNVGKFMKDNNAIYKYTARHLGGFKKAVDNWYPGLYYKIAARRPQSITPEREEELAADIVKRFNSGFCISSTYLQASLDPKERELARRIADCAKTDLLGKKENFADTVHRLTGIPADDVHLGSGVQKNAAELTENFTSFLFYWSSLLGLETWGFDTNNWIYHKSNALKFFPGEERQADLRIGNRAVEVKTGIAKFSEERKNEIVQKYGNHGVWQTGETVEKGAVFFHARTKLYEHFFPAVKAAGMAVVTYEDFHRHLEQLVEVMKTKSSMYRDVRPIVNLDYLVDLHREISLHPFLLVRKENNFRREWSKSILEALIERAQGLRDQREAAK